MISIYMPSDNVVLVANPTDINSTYGILGIINSTIYANYSTRNIASYDLNGKLINSNFISLSLFGNYTEAECGFVYNNYLFFKSVDSGQTGYINRYDVVNRTIIKGTVPTSGKSYSQLIVDPTGTYVYYVADVLYRHPFVVNSTTSTALTVFTGVYTSPNMVGIIAIIQNNIYIMSRISYSSQIKIIDSYNIISTVYTRNVFSNLVQSNYISWTSNNTDTIYIATSTSITSVNVLTNVINITYATGFSNLGLTNNMAGFMTYYNSRLYLLDAPTGGPTYNLYYVDLNYVCFKEDSLILTDQGYVPIQELRKGHLVRTEIDGFVPIYMIAMRTIYHPASSERIKDQLYQCSTENYPEVFEPLVITGCHSILVDNFISDEQKKKSIEVNGDLHITGEKYRLPACVDKRTTVYDKPGNYTIYHFALENDNYYFNYGVYANGLLVETCSKRYISELSNMKIIE